MGRAASFRIPRQTAQTDKGGQARHVFARLYDLTARNVAAMVAAHCCGLSNGLSTLRAGMLRRGVLRLVAVVLVTGLLPACFGTPHRVNRDLVDAGLPVEASSPNSASSPYAQV